METLTHPDTHIVCWFYQGASKQLKRLKPIFESNILMVSPIVELELQFLFEINRTTQPGKTVISELNEYYDLRVSSTPFHQIIAQSLQENWTRDPFDRIIVANAKVDKAALLTKDANIRKHFSEAFWT